MQHNMIMMWSPARCRYNHHFLFGSSGVAGTLGRRLLVQSCSSSTPTLPLSSSLVHSSSSLSSSPLLLLSSRRRRTGNGNCNSGHSNNNSRNYNNSHNSINRNYSNNSSTNTVMGPSYQVYGEETALTIRAIPPEFRVLPKSGTIVLDSSKRGRLLFEFTPRNNSNNNYGTNSSTGSGGGGSKYQWDKPIRFALTAEEAASLLATLDDAGSNNGGNGVNQPVVVEIVRTPRPPGMSPRPGGGGGGGPGFYADDNTAISMETNKNPDKVFRARFLPPGSGSAIELAVDFEYDGRGGQDPPTMNESRGPLEIKLMLGEYNVMKSIIQYSIPRLIGWSTMMDHSMEQALDRAIGSRGGGGGGGFYPSYDDNNMVPF